MCPKLTDHLPIVNSIHVFLHVATIFATRALTHHGAETYGFRSFVPQAQTRRACAYSTDCNASKSTADALDPSDPRGSY